MHRHDNRIPMEVERESVSLSFRRTLKRKSKKKTEVAKSNLEPFITMCLIALLLLWVVKPYRSRQTNFAILPRMWPTCELSAQIHAFLSSYPAPSGHYAVGERASDIT